MDGLSFSNLGYLERQYLLYREHPQAIEVSWRQFFAGWDLAQQSAPSQEELLLLKSRSLIEAYRSYGYLQAQTNPLLSPKEIEKLSPAYHGFKEQDLNTIFLPFSFSSHQECSLQQLCDSLRKVYCGRIGFQYKGWCLPELEKWIEEFIESEPISLSSQEKEEIFCDLNRAELLEQFLHRRFTGQKRFSLEGGESLIPMLTFLLGSAIEEGISEVIFGMAHRGRMNLLTHLLNKPYEAIFQEFQDLSEDSEKRPGDVKYHKGFRGKFVSKGGQTIEALLSPNPSHLESVNPLITGEARAKQDARGNPLSVLPILIHGDAAMSGQGVVYETLQLSKLKGYQTGGTLHIILNNQIGFTTSPEEGRSTPYCTDIGIPFGIPIFHINGDFPEEAVYAARLALKIRQTFQCDLFLSLNCYRKYGHNEGDDPTFTQPLEYQIIKAKKSVRELYKTHLLEEKILELPAIEEIERAQHLKLETAFNNSSTKIPQLFDSDERARTPPEVVPSLICLQELMQQLYTAPSGFHLHPKIQKLLDHRLKVKEEPTANQNIDWGIAEDLAYATLLSEGKSIRISGQDSCRGTFSQRHSIWIDQQEENKSYIPLSQFKERKGSFQIFNSPLSEYAVLGFELGYTLTSPQTLVIWEAQFGDFSNAAQVIIDQYISSEEQKWGDRSGITLFLPHGYEGQGAEHSSARIERYLQLSANENWRIVNSTTPAQSFHLLRGQAMQKKPLVLFTPKELLRRPECFSSLEELATGKFYEILDDTTLQEGEAERVLLCSGKIYYDLLAERKMKKIALVRIEQLYPFQKITFQQILEKYRKVPEWYWVQEEPENMGAWSYLQPILNTIIGKEVHYVGRIPSTTTAVGSYRVHKEQQMHVVTTAYANIQG